MSTDPLVVTANARTRAKLWVATVNGGNAEGEEPLLLLDPELWVWPDGVRCVWLAYQLEVGESGNLHFQCAFAFDDRRSFTQVKALEGLQGAHLQQMRGKPSQAEAYVTKDKTRVDGPWIFGDTPTGQGQRNDIVIAVEILTLDPSQRGMKRVLEEQPSVFVKYISGLQKAASLLQEVRDFQTILICLYGPGGSGKSTFARQLAQYLNVIDEPGTGGGVYHLPMAKGSGLYWDGYSSNSIVIIDEMCGARMKPTDFKALIDSSPHSIPIHGGFLQFRSRYIICTTNVAPVRWWSQPQGGYAPIQRRLHIPLLFRHRIGFQKAQQISSVHIYGPPSDRSNMSPSVISYNGSVFLRHL